MPLQPAPSAQRYVRPAGFVTRNLLNRSVAALAAAGISLYGSRMLWVRGRSTGQWRRTPVNPLTLNGERYLVAPRGHVQWTKNLRASGGGELHLGRRAEEFAAIEVADADKPDILRAYLRAWAFESGAFFDGVSADSPDSDLVRISPRHPVFRLAPPA